MCIFILSGYIVINSKNMNTLTIYSPIYFDLFCTKKVKKPAYPCMAYVPSMSVVIYLYMFVSIIFLKKKVRNRMRIRKEKLQKLFGKLKNRETLKALFMGFL